MRKITGWRSAGVQGKKEKMRLDGREKERGIEVGEEENQRKDSVQKCAIKSSFIHTVSNYQCICSIPSGVPIVFKNKREHT